MIKLKWEVAPYPTGRYRSFETRGWPNAEYPNGENAVYLRCSDAYYPPYVKIGRHEEIRIQIAVWHPKENGEGETFDWKTLKLRAKTLKEAKEIAQDFINKHPECRPEAYKPR